MINCSKTINANVVVATPNVQVFFEHTETIEPPALELLPPVVSVTFDRVVPLRGKIIIQGTVHKNILYKAEGGLVRHTAVTIPFAKEVEIPGFNPGSLINGRFFNTGNDFRFFIDQIFVDQTLLDPRTVLEKIVIRFVVKVIKEEKIQISAKPAQTFHCSAEQHCHMSQCQNFGC